ncbi:MAG TPA: class I SAM-dependent methyltransferase [Caldilineae bacterium]|nr:class I SAM-dependent methyltransferase [Caldilineae bacterium]
MSEDRIIKLRNDIREYEAACLIAELVGEARVILNVGPSWGRDFYALTERGKQVVNMDIAPQRHLLAMVRGDASQGFPFPARFFDAVVMPEVLEHLIGDWIAFEEARRVLKDDGRLIVTVPFYNDQPPYHVRIHSPRTIFRLLAASGFSAERIIYRGGWIRFPRLVHAIRKILAPLKLSKAWYRAVVAMDRWWGEQPWSQRWAKGVYILARKDKALDWRHINVEEFRH